MPILVEVAVTLKHIQGITDEILGQLLYAAVSNSKT